MLYPHSSMHYSIRIRSQSRSRARADAHAHTPTRCARRVQVVRRAEQNALLWRLRERLAHMELADDGAAAERLLHL